MAGSRMGARVATRAMAWWPLVGLLAWGCSGGATSSTDVASSRSSTASSTDVSVPECAAYAHKLAVCFQRSDLESQVPTVAHDEAEHERMRTACSTSLHRITTACR